MRALSDGEAEASDFISLDHINLAHELPPLEDFSDLYPDEPTDITDRQTALSRWQNRPADLAVGYIRGPEA